MSRVEVQRLHDAWEALIKHPALKGVHDPAFQAFQDVKAAIAALDAPRAGAEVLAERKAVAQAMWLADRGAEPEFDYEREAYLKMADAAIANLRPTPVGPAALYEDET